MRPFVYCGYKSTLDETHVCVNALLIQTGQLICFLNQNWSVEKNKYVKNIYFRTFNLVLIDFIFILLFYVFTPRITSLLVM